MKDEELSCGGSALPSVRFALASWLVVFPSVYSVLPSMRFVFPSVRSVLPSARAVLPCAPSVLPSVCSVFPSMRFVFPSLRSALPSARAVLHRLRGGSGLQAGVIVFGKIQYKCLLRIDKKGFIVEVLCELLNNRES